MTADAPAAASSTDALEVRLLFPYAGQDSSSSAIRIDGGGGDKHLQGRSSQLRRRKSRGGAMHTDAAETDEPPR